MNPLHRPLGAARGAPDSAIPAGRLPLRSGPEARAGAARRPAAWIAALALAAPTAAAPASTAGSRAAVDPATSTEPPPHTTSRRGAEPELGSWFRTISGLETPVAAAFAADGRLFVVERDAHRVRTFDSNGEEVDAFGSRGARPGQLLAPGGIAIAADGRVAVADTGNHRVSIFDDRGGFIRTIGSRGAGDGELCRPTGLCWRDDELFVADTGGDRVQLFGEDGEWRATFGAAEGLHLARPVDVAWLDGSLFVADGDHHRVVRVAVEGTDGPPLGAAAPESAFGAGVSEAAFGGWGFFPGLFSELTSVEASGGRLFTSDGQNHRVQVFEPTGELAYTFGLHAIRPREGRGKLHYPADLCVRADGMQCVLVEPLDDRIQYFGVREGEDPDEALRKGTGQPSAHYGPKFAVDGDHMVILEPETHTLLVYDLQWTLPRQIGKLGGYGDELGLFDVPQALAFDGRALELWVADRGGRSLHHVKLRIDREGEVKFDPNMALWLERLEFERLGRELGGVRLTWPVRADALARDAAGILWIADARNERVHALGPDLTYRFGFGTAGGEPGRFRGLTDIALAPDGSRIYVCESEGARVQAFDRDGNVVATFGAGSLERPGGLHVASDGRVFVSDEATNLVHRFGPSGEHQAIWGGDGLERLQFSKPRGIEAWDGGLCVLDHGNHRLQWFSELGEYGGVYGSRLYTRPARFPGLAWKLLEEREEGEQ